MLYSYLLLLYNPIICSCYALLFYTPVNRSFLYTPVMRSCHVFLLYTTVMRPRYTSSCANVAKAVQ